jgi:hypothetical protein
MAKVKKAPATRPTGADVEEFLASVPDEQRRADARRLTAMMAEVTGEPPALWGPSIIGFGQYHYRYASGHEGDAPVAGFAPRKPHLVVYLVGDYETHFGEALTRLGPHKTGKSCLYVKRLSDVDEAVLREMIERSMQVARDVDAGA